MTSPEATDATRFLTLADVAEVLNVELPLVRELVQSGELVAIRIGNDGPLRVEQRELELFIADKYEARRREQLFAGAEFTDIPELSYRR